MEEILSDETIPIERNFKVSAGPGAGKTHWLILHVKNVLQNSKRLAKTAKIACITYTNTGVEEIQTGLGNVAERVEVSTIHSFLYNNIVKPYSFLLKNNDGRYLINLQRLDGHDEHIPSPDIVYNWKRTTKQVYLNDDKKVMDCLVDLDWQFNEHGQLELLPRNSWKARIGKYWIKKNSYSEYKELYWNRGQIHHEDVLYFAYRLITEEPEIVSFLRAKFPYIYIDEFQDTHPVQTAIIKKIGECETIVGVIGDSAQSIYGFQGAARRDFIEFALPEIKYYAIKGNRRSTVQIVNLLNRIRKDEIEQTCLRDESGSKVKLIIGDKLDTVEFVKQEVEEIVILARNNTTVSQLKGQIEESTEDLWGLSRSMDSNFARQELIYHTLYSTELINNRKFSEARKRVSRLFRKRIDGTTVSQADKRVYTISLLESILNGEDISNLAITNYNNNLFEFVERNFNVRIGAKISRGNYKDNFGDKYTCKDLVTCLKVRESADQIRTIHQAKGSQFTNVLVVLDKLEGLERITKANLETDDDESRIYYVALSRAQNHLYISVPEINLENRQLIEALDVEISEL